MKFLSANFLSCVINDYIEDMVTFTTLVKIYSTEYFYNTKVAGLGETFVQQKFLAISYTHVTVHVYIVCAIMYELYLQWIK